MKNEIRYKAKKHRKTLDILSLSNKIKSNLLTLPEYINAKNILTYYSFGEEVCTTSYFEDKSKNWFLPKIDEENILVCKYEETKLKKNKYNIYEPITQYEENTNILDLIIVPALAADKKGYRVGYGKGYYDRFLMKIRNDIPKIILIYHDLFFETVYPEKHDINCSIIVTDKEIYRIKC